jgi:tetratricopeptide (TPR) repeat protein
MTRRLEQAVGGLCKDLAEVEHAPVPRLVISDRALRAFATMTASFREGDMDGAWLAYADLLREDPRCGRAGMFAMEMFLALAQTQSGEQNAELLRKAIKAGRDALKHVPNDTHIRGRLGWILAMHFNRGGLGALTLRQALKVQPGSMDEIERLLAVWKVDDRDAQIEWLKEYAAPKVKDGRVELLVGNTLYGQGDYAGGVEWYARGIAIAPGDYELRLSAGMCGFYLGQSLARQLRHDDARAAFADATENMRAALRVDSLEVKWLYDYYVRNATANFSSLPTNPEELTELFLVQAVLTGLESNSRTKTWDRLVADVINVQKRLLRAEVREARPDDALYALKLMARLRLANVDQDTDEMIHTLWLMRHAGLRPQLYHDYNARYGALVDDYTPED